MVEDSIGWEHEWSLSMWLWAMAWIDEHQIRPSMFKMWRNCPISGLIVECGGEWGLIALFPFFLFFWGLVLTKERLQPYGSIFRIYLKIKIKKKVRGEFPPFGLTIEIYNAASTTTNKFTSIASGDSKFTQCSIHRYNRIITIQRGEIPYILKEWLISLETLVDVILLYKVG